MSPTCLEAVHAWFGASILGAVDVTLNTAYRGQTLSHGVNLSGARLIVLDTELLRKLREVEGDLESLEVVATIGEPREVPAFERLKVVSLDEVEPVAELPEVEGPTYRDLASVVYTSGTSGPAKGVLISHAQAYASGREAADGFRMTSDDVFYCFHPLFHVAPKFYAVYASLLCGARVVLDRRFEASTWLGRVRSYGATLTIAHGPMIEQIAAEPQRPDDADNPLRAFMAAPFPAAIAEEFEARFDARGLEVYGMTEITTVTWRPLDEPLRLGSCGKVLDDVFDVRVVDENDEELPPGEVGEIVVRSKHPWTLMAGYLSMPEQTIAAWRNLWFHTGDAAYFDEDGWMYYVDRARDRIRRRAENISSYDVEVGATSHPGVLEAAAVGVASAYEADDEIKLYVVAASELEPLELLEHLVAHLPHYMVPRYIEFVSELPRTPTNKVRKTYLRELGVTEATWDRKTAAVSIREIARAQEGAGA
jgi:crotonobetaine/carnitine-CoA ligase